MLQSPMPCCSPALTHWLRYAENQTVPRDYGILCLLLEALPWLSWGSGTGATTNMKNKQKSNNTKMRLLKNHRHIAT